MTEAVCPCLDLNVSSMRRPPPTVPPQFIIFLTLVVDMIFLLRKKSASCPPIGTTMVITMWGTADRSPTWKQFRGDALRTNSRPRLCTEANEERQRSENLLYYLDITTNFRCAHCALKIKKVLILSLMKAAKKDRDNKLTGIFYVKIKKQWRWFV